MEEGISGRGRVNKEGKGRIWSMYFVYVYEDVKLKPVKVILRSEERDKRE
jgi:hypothetical protein